MTDLRWLMTVILIFIYEFYCSNFILKLNILTLPLYILRRLALQFHDRQPVYHQFLRFYAVSYCNDYKKSECTCIAYYLTLKYIVLKAR
jgi:hypothetical protein